MQTLAFYLNGNYGSLLSRFPQYLIQFNSIALCQNKLAYDTAKSSKAFSSESYLYNDFNAKYAKLKSVNLNWLYTSYPEVNLQTVYESDKSHYKRIEKSRVLKIIATMSHIFHEWISTHQPDFIFFPIIESMDAMLLYQMCRSAGVKTMVYTECRIIPRSFISNTCFEDLPQEPISSSNINHQLEIYLKNINYRLSNKLSLVTLDDYEPDYDANIPLFIPLPKRIVSHLKRKLFFERHNLLISSWIKLQVNFHVIFDLIATLRYKTISHFICKPKLSLPKTYDYYPLHFSPESSINTPAPYYIDQLRVIDRILVDRNNSVPLIIKEHPAMRRNRPISFYLEAKKRFNLFFVPLSFNSIDLISQSRCVYSVTGTACLEAFALGKKWHQYGPNVLTSWFSISNHDKANNKFSDFIYHLTSISYHFLIRSPTNSASRLNYILFSNKNIASACQCISNFASNKNVLV